MPGKIAGSPGTFSTGRGCAATKAEPLIIGNHDCTSTHAVPETRSLRLLTFPRTTRSSWKYEPKQDPNVIPVMCCDTVNRGVVLWRIARYIPSSGRHHFGPRWMPRPARSFGAPRTADPGKGCDWNLGRHSSSREQGPDRQSPGGEFGVQCHVHRLRYEEPARKPGARSPEGPDDQIKFDAEKDHGARQGRSVRIRA